MKPPVISFLLLLLLLWPSVIAAADDENNNANATINNNSLCNLLTEDVLTISFHLSQEAFQEVSAEEVFFDWSVQLVSPSASSSSSSNHSSEDNFWYMGKVIAGHVGQHHRVPGDIPDSETVCLPKDTCAVLLVDGFTDIHQFSAQLYKHNHEQQREQEQQQPLLLQPRLVAPSESNLRWRVDIGDCTLDCAEDGTEALLDVEAYSVVSPPIQSRIFLKLEHISTSDNREIPILPPDFSPSIGHFHRIQKCLPVDDTCYRLTFVDESWNVYEQFDQLSLHVSFDGELIANQSNSRFGMIEFGNGCSSFLPTTCNNPDNESVLEFFLSSSNNDHLLSWSLTDTSNHAIEHLKGNITRNDTTTPHNLHYVKECVPSNTCLTFQLWIPDAYLQTANDGLGYMEQVMFRVVLDDTIYYDKVSRFSRDWIEQGKQESMESVLIGNCTGSTSACNTSRESLLDLQMEFGNTNNPHVVPWVVENTSSLRWDWIARFAGDFEFVVGYFPNTSYAHYKCIPKNDCFQFTVHQRDVMQSRLEYRVAFDGVELPSQLSRRGSGYMEQITVLGGENCQTSLTSLTSLAIVVIVVCGSMLLLALFLTFKICSRGGVVDPANGMGGDEEATVASEDSSKAAEDEQVPDNCPEQAVHSRSN